MPSTAIVDGSAARAGNDSCANVTSGSNVRALTSMKRVGCGASICEVTTTFERLLVHAGGLNLGLLMRALFGVGTPRGLQGRAAAFLATFVASRNGRDNDPHPMRAVNGTNPLTHPSPCTRFQVRRRRGFCYGLLGRPAPCRSHCATPRHEPQKAD